MYRMLSVCLTLGFLFGEVTTVKNEIEDVNITIDSGLKKPRGEENIEVNELKNVRTSSDSEHSINTVDKKIKKFKTKHDRSKDEVAKRNTHSVIPIVSSQSNTNKNLENYIPSAETLIQKDKQRFEEFNPGNLKRLPYVQGPKAVSNQSQTSLLSRENPTLFFSEYGEGSAQHKFLEIYNPTNEIIDLTGYAYPNSNNGASVDGVHDYWNTFADGASIAPGAVYIIADSDADSSIVALANELHEYLSNGDDGYCLVMGTETDYELVDCIGTFTETDPGSGWDVAGVSSATANSTLVRKANVVAGNAGDWATSAGTNADDSEWIVYPSNTWGYLGTHEIEMEEGGLYFSESFEGVFPTEGWTFEEVEGSGTWQQSPYNGFGYAASFAYEGEYFVYFNDYSFTTGTVGAMVSPVIDLTESVSPILYFQYWDGPYSGSDFVDVQVSQPDGSFTTIFSTPTATVGWEEQQVDLSAYVGTSVSVRFVGTSVYGSSNPSIDDIIVSEPPSYPIANVSTGVINFGPVFVSGSKDIDFAIINTGGDVLTGAASSSNTSFTVSRFPLNGVAPGDTAVLTATYAPTAEQSDAGYIVLTHNADSSPDSVMVSGTGTLNILTEGFDGPWTGDPAAPAGWTVVNSDGDSYTWTQANTYISFDVNGYAAHGMGSQNDWLISPLLTIDGGYNLKWWDVVESSLRNNTYDVYVFPAGDTTAGVNLGTYDCINTDLTQHTLDLSAYDGQSISIGFHQTYSASTIYGFGIEDVTVEPIPLRPVLVFGSPNIGFSPTFVGSTVSSSLNIGNEGGAAANIEITSSSAEFSVSPTSVVIESGTSQDISISYTPSEVGNDSGYVIFTHGGDSSPDSIMVFGSGNLNLLTEGFDGPWTGDPAAPAGWTVVNSGDDFYTWRQANTYIPEVNGYAAYGSGNQDDWLISPLLTIDGGYNLKWWDVVESSFYNNTYDVYVFPAGDTTAGVNLGTYDCVNTVLTQHILNLSAYDGQSISIGFHQTYSYSSGWGFGIEDVTVEPLPQTPIISVSSSSLGFMATQIDSNNTKELVFYNTGSGDLEGTIVYSDGFTGPASFGASDDTIAISFSPASSGMISGTATITSNGGDDIVISLSGNAGTSIATWDTDVDGDGEGDWPVGWETVNLDGNGSGWEFFGGGGHTGDGYTSAGQDGSGTINDDWLISPKYLVAAGDVFSFYASDDGGSLSYPDIMTVHVSPVGSTIPETFTVSLDTVVNMGTSWLPYSYDLSEYVGTEIRMAIVYRGEWGYALNIDDIAGPEIIQETGPVIYDYPSSLLFALEDVVSVGDSDTLLFDYFNNGGSDLEVTSVTFQGPFSLSSEVTLPVVTTASGIGSFEVVFTPLADSLYSGSMTVSNNNVDITVPLSGVGFDGIYHEGFGYVDATSSSEWSEGWMFSDDGVMGPDDQPFTNGTEAYWQRTSFGGTTDGMLYHGYTSGSDADTAISAAIELPLVEGSHYELETREFMQFGSYATLCGIAISTDSGQSFTLLGEADYAITGQYNAMYDLTGYSGQTVHLALVYQGTFGNNWAVLDMKIRSKEDPIIPVFARSKPVFPATKIGESSSAMVYYANVGVGSLSADITYPASMTGEASITDLAPGVQDSMLITYTPTVPGIETGTIVVDGSASGAAVSNIPFDANAGELAFDMENSSAGWRNYSLAGAPWTSPAGSIISDRWTYWRGSNGHSATGYYGVYGYEPYWGGVNDFLVSPRYDISDALEVLSFYAAGGYNSNGDDPDSLNVWVSTEMPEMGFEEIPGPGPGGMLTRVDTGFVNTDAFTLVHSSVPPYNYGGVSVDLSSYSSDVWVLIQALSPVGSDGWMLRVDDIASPDIYYSQDPILSAVERYNFGTTSPAGDTVNLVIRNTGIADLIIDSLELANGEAYNLDLVDDEFPVTVMQDSVVLFPVVFAPYEDGPAMDTLMYYSNYVAGNVSIINHSR